MFIHIADRFFIVILGILSFFPKKDKRERCSQCNTLITESRLSCKECGYLFSTDSVIEKSSNDSYYKTIVMKAIDEFDTIKDQIIEEYALLGYTVRTIDKHDSLMLKKENVTNSYVLVERDGFETTIELYNLDGKIA